MAIIIIIYYVWLALLLYVKADKNKCILCHFLYLFALLFIVCAILIDKFEANWHHIYTNRNSDGP
jgi:hypothetical protein